MADELRTTTLGLTYRDRDGEATDLGTATIDERGMITNAAPAEGQEDLVGGMIDDLNKREDVLVDVPAGADQPKFAVASIRVPRDAHDFLVQLRKYVRKLYRVEMAFDLAALGAREPQAPVHLGGAKRTAPADDGLTLPAASRPAGPAPEIEDDDAPDPDLEAFLADDEPEDDTPVEDDSEDLAAWGEVKKAARLP